MTKVCEKCGVEFEPKLERARFCSRKCIESAYSTVPVTVVCPMCGTSRVMSRAGSIRAIKAHSCCPSCATDRLEGSNNGNWRGGHRHWSPGRHGKDKDGLSWKTQRTLAWARDNFTCQHCGKVPKRKPDVHHINPWMNSLSHALDNLICLCQSCHLKEEAKIQEVWGGQLVTSIKREPLPRCSLCHSPKGRVVSEGLCQGCYKTSVLKPKALALHKQGVSGSEIARQMGFTPQAINFWLRCNK